MAKQNPTSRLRSGMVLAAVVGAFGGIAPELIKIVAKLLRDEFPGSGQLVALGVLAVLGFFTVLIYNEVDLKKAMMLGVGAPALVGSLVGQTAPLASESVSWLELVPAAYAQEQDMRVRLVFVQNDPDVPLESLWVRADGKTVGTSIQENVMHVKLPGSTKRLTISPPGSAKGLTLTRETLHRSEGIVELKITDNKFWKQFFQTLNNPDVAQYRIELAK